MILPPAQASRILFVAKLMSGPGVGAGPKNVPRPGGGELAGRFLPWWYRGLAGKEVYPSPSVPRSAARCARTVPADSERRVEGF